MIINNDQLFSIYYYIDKENIALIDREKKSYNNKVIFNEIEKLISNSEINIDEKNKLKGLFTNQNNKTLKDLVNINFSLLNIIDNILEELFNDIKNILNEKDDNIYIINSNYIYYKIKNCFE